MMTKSVWSCIDELAERCELGFEQADNEMDEDNDRIAAVTYMNVAQEYRRCWRAERKLHQGMRAFHEAKDSESAHKAMNRAYAEAEAILKGES